MKMHKITFIYRSGSTEMDVAMQDLFWLKEMIKKAERSGEPSLRLVTKLKEIETQIVIELGEVTEMVGEVVVSKFPGIIGEVTLKVGRKNLIFEKYSKVVEVEDHDEGNSLP